MGLDISFVACPRDQLSEVGEFRKVNALLQWVNNNVMSVENCAYIPISKEVLEILQGTLNQLTTDNCQELFPTQEGFFYGSTEYDEHYWEDVADVKVWVDETLAHFEFE
ncbi:hypothetical protein DM558_02675 [Entomomonas moraniae]|uniref:Uncharacterized protein n=1 Tax=Entomomonas moraniae TaxID=2213226 RepID=A0A3Q9JHJ1_9GAMM|nr:hypothetical protein [Entomomonas moraniae]AZS49752.1 hypothetical protein DM558_02675 [Entomomonas moraniae]